jgi:glucose-1-phosphate adenylyltransferase
MAPVENVLAVILGGGRGTRLFPLTRHRSKPAVPIGAKYRLIDIPISNCLNSHLPRIFVLTQYNSQSLNDHLGRTYKFDIFSPGFVNIMAAEQTDESPDWFQGTADAVRQSWGHMLNYPFAEVMILSGDQLYQMDYRRMVETHRQKRADITVAVKPVSAEATSGFGILKVNQQGRIVHFEEKPGADRLDDLESEVPGVGKAFLASMGIYVFSKEALRHALEDTSLVDFGRNVIPELVPRKRVQAFVHRGYWEDVGTIRSYYEAGLGLTDPVPPFDFYEASRPVYTHPRFLPATKVEQCSLRLALVSEGSILVGAEVERAVIGIRSRVGRGVQIRNSLILGADYYQTLDDLHQAEGRAEPPVGIGEDSVIEGAIIDKNARIGRGVRISSDGERPDGDGDGFFVRDGIVIVPKNGIIRDGTSI